MLSPLVEPFYPIMEILMEAIKQVIEEKTEKERNLGKTEKNQNTKETTTLVKANNKTNINLELKEYKDIKQNVIKIETNNKVGDTNYHQELQETDQEVKEEGQKSSGNKVIIGKLKQIRDKNYNVNKITMEEMEKVISQCIGEEKNNSCSISNSKKRDGE